MLLNEINNDYKNAIKERNELKKDVLSIVKSEIDKQSKNTKEMSDDLVMDIVSKLAKKCREAQQIYADKNQMDLANKEKQEIEILEKYLPEQISEEELKKVIQSKINLLGATGPKDMGRVMSEVMKDVKGKADGKVVNSIVRDILAG